MLKPQGTVIFGYCVENRRPYQNIEREFLERTVKLHLDQNVPCTFFIVGKTLEQNRAVFRNLLPRRSTLFDLQHHTYGHIYYDRVPQCHIGGGNREVASVNEIEKDLRDVAAVFSHVLGKKPEGMVTPVGFYRGLLGRPEILNRLNKQNIKFVTSWNRNKKGWKPLRFSVQPFWYDRANENLPQMLEIPSQGWEDGLWREKFGEKNDSGYRSYLKRTINLLSKKKLSWGFIAHDYIMCKYQNYNNFEYLFKEASKKNVRILNYKQFYMEQEVLRSKSVGVKVL